MVFFLMGLYWAQFNVMCSRLPATNQHFFFIYRIPNVLFNFIIRPCICMLLYSFFPVDILIDHYQYCSSTVISNDSFCSFLHCAVDPNATFHQLVLMALSASGSGIHVPSSLGENHKKQHAPSGSNAGCVFMPYFDYYAVGDTVFFFVFFLNLI